MSNRVEFERVDDNTPSRRWFWIVGFVALVLVAALVVSLLTWARPAEEQAAAEAASPVENPELNVFRRYSSVVQADADEALLAENPELSSARRYALEAARENEAVVLAENPELNSARRYTCETDREQDPAFLAANPEMMLYQRYVAEEQPAFAEARLLACIP